MANLLPGRRGLAKCHGFDPEATDGWPCAHGSPITQQLGDPCRSPPNAYSAGRGYRVGTTSIAYRKQARVSWTAWAW